MPQALAGLCTMGQTSAYPGLPLITSSTTAAATMVALRDALAWVTQAPAMAQVREDLFIRAFEALPIAHYQVCRDMRDAAVAAVAPIIADVVTALGTEKVRSVLPVLRELRLRMESEA